MSFMHKLKTGCYAARSALMGAHNSWKMGVNQFPSCSWYKTGLMAKRCSSSRISSGPSHIHCTVLGVKNFSLKEMIIFRIYGTSRKENAFPAKPLYFKGLKWCKISPRAIVKSSAGILSALEQWSNADFSWFQLILGWFRVGKCRFYQCCASPQ